ncbi:MAG TPA: DUF2058 domain-containing protein [Luteimonas sp.]|nr:DUF2058 domain-containing protein [Luteimonas sp.]
MANDLRQQLLKAGLARKSDVARVVREQTKQRHAKTPAPTGTEDRIDARQLQAERAERDRQLSAERNAQARAQELRAQARQIVASSRVEGAGEIAYAFEHAGAIRRVVVDVTQRNQLASGALVVARHDGGYVLLPRAAADKVAVRDPAVVVLDHAAASQGAAEIADPAYLEFPVPDDLVW